MKTKNYHNFTQFTFIPNIKKIWYKGDIAIYEDNALSIPTCNEDFLIAEISPGLESRHGIVTLRKAREIKKI